jgi:hypothetical protein
MILFILFLCQKKEGKIMIRLINLMNIIYYYFMENNQKRKK